MTSLTSELRAVGREIVVVGIAAAFVVLCYSGINAVLSHRAKEKLDRARQKTASLPLVASGATLQIKDVQLSRTAWNLVLVLSPDCVHCVQSAPFYRSLRLKAQQHGITVYVAVPDLGRAGAFLKSAGLDRAGVKSWEQLGFRVRGTPTLILADNLGVARRIWVGRLLTPATEAEALQVLEDPSKPASTLKTSEGARGISLEELHRIQNTAPVTVLDIRERDEFKYSHVPGSINVPLSELNTRAAYELSRSALQVVDCSNVTEQLCSAALLTLAADGFKTRSLTAGAVSGTCAMTQN